MSKPTPISDILRKIRPLALHHQAAYLRSHIAVESGGNFHKTSVRIRELQAALHDVTMRRLKREKAA
jgi:hypothetical protein